MKKITFIESSALLWARNFQGKINGFAYAIFLALLLASLPGHAQINYSYGWDPTGLGGWVTGGEAGDFSRSTTSPCTGAGSVRTNAYYGAGSTLRSPSLGTSNGGLVTLQYNYKVVEYSNVATPAAAANVSILVQWSSATAGPWTTIQTINSANHDPSASCTNRTATFAPPSGAVYVRFYATGLGSSDLYYYFDDISATQGAAPSCAMPTAMTATATSFTAATLSWTAPATAPANGYEYYRSTASTAPVAATPATGSVGAGVVTAPQTGLAAETTYYIWVRSICSGTDKSLWNGPVTFFTGYCTPAPTSVDGIGITNFTLGTINNTTIEETNNYGNYSSMSASVGAGSTVNFSITYTTDYEYGTKIWVDWNNDLDFTDAGELVYTGLSADGAVVVLTGSFVVPTTASAGNHRIRVGGTDNDAGPDSPCYTGTYGSFEDYTLNVFIPNTPVITSFTPASYCAANGVITITGTSLTGAQLTIGTTAVPTTTNTATQITATVPAGVSGPVKIVTAGGTVVSTTSFAVTAPPAITFSNATPSICAGASTSAITLTAGGSSYTNFVWSPATGVTGNATSGFIFNPAATTAYTLTASNTTSGCVITVPLRVTVNALPAAVTITAPAGPVCIGSVQALTVSGASASGNATLGTGTTAPSSTENPNPFNAWYGGHKTQMLYKASELRAQGLVTGSTISAIAFEFEVSAANTNNDLKIRIGSTANETTTAGFVPLTTLTTVYSATYTPTQGATGYVSFSFTAPYIWDGNNIIVEVVHNQGNSGNGAATRTRTTTTTFDSVYFLNKDGVTPAGAASFDALTPATWVVGGVNVSGTSTSRPNARFAYAIANTVAWTPTTNLFTDAAATVPYTNQNIATVYTKPTANITYVATVTNVAGCSVNDDIAIVVANPSVAPVADAAQSFCNAATVASLLPDTAGIKWYAAATGGNALTATTALVNGTTYYASQTSTGGCESTARTAVTVQINIAPAPEATAVQSFCNAGTVAELMPNTATIKWYTAATGGNPLEATTALVDDAVYYASQTTTAGCESLERTAVTVQINSTPAPAADATQEFCNAGTVNNLVALGQDGAAIRWYAAASGGVALDGTTALVDNTIYYAAQIPVEGCESLARTAVTVQINSTPAPTADATQEFCNAGLVNNLVALGQDGAAINWYAAETGGVALDGTTPLVDGTTYYASQAPDEGCESLARTAVEVTVNVVQAPTGDAVQTVTVTGGIGATLADLVVTTSTTGEITWYESEEDALAGENPITENTPVVSGTTYYATQTVGECTSTTVFSVTVTVVLGNKDFDLNAFSYYPNPVKDVLNFSYTSDISSVAVYNLLGQQVVAKQINAAEGKIDMSNLSDGTYIVNITAGNSVKTIKVIKQQ